MIKRGCLVLFLLMLTGCASAYLAPEQRLQRHDALLQAQHWQGAEFRVMGLPFKLYYPEETAAKAAADVLYVFIEGDGFAWRTPETPSDNPTPLQPVALNMALHWQRTFPEIAIAYVGRPCQYVATGTEGCRQEWWTNRRFAPEVVQGTQAALEELKTRFGAEHLVLIGYSGGGAIALLAAAERYDVLGVMTFAGNVDTHAWVQEHGLTPLTGSLNPADATEALKDVWQYHFVGGRDKVIPASLFEGYAARFPVGKKPLSYLLPAFDHTCCWGRYAPPENVFHHMKNISKRIE